MAKAKLIGLSRGFLNTYDGLDFLYNLDGELITLERKYWEANGVLGRRQKFSWQVKSPSSYY